VNAQSEHQESEISSEEAAQAQKVMILFANAIEAAGTEGIPGEVIGSAALAAALRMLVAVHGVETVSKLIGALPERVVSGDFSD
jgi:hypothetical protein